MSRDDGRMLNEGFDAYVDGALGAQQHAEFERRVQGDPALQAEQVRQRAIDAALGRLFPVPGAERAEALIRAAGQAAGQAAAVGRHAELVREDHATGSPMRRRGVHRLRILAYAACALFLAGGGWWLASILREPSVLSTGSVAAEFRPVDPLDAVRRIEREKHEPDLVCEDDQQFAALVWMRTNQGLLLAQPLPVGVEVVGWNMRQTVLSWKTLILMARVDGQWVYVIIDARANDRSLTVPSGSGQRLFRDEVGALVAYELTPFDGPRLIGLLYDPKRDDSWYRAGIRW